MERSSCPSRGLQPNNNEASPSLGGYAIDHRTKILALLPRCHKDPHVHGADAHEFKPERMLDRNLSRLPKSAWKPFFTGVKACIGRPFALQEALLVVALILQGFDLRLDDPAYELRIQRTLTMDPEVYICTLLHEWYGWDCNATNADGRCKQHLCI